MKLGMIFRMRVITISFISLALHISLLSSLYHPLCKISSRKKKCDKLENLMGLGSDSKHVSSNEEKVYKAQS